MTFNITCILIIQDDQFYISTNISGSPISYTTYAFNIISGDSFNSTANLTSCEEASAGGCVLLLSAYCSMQSANINVTISAANKLGEGPRSNPFIIGKRVYHYQCNNLKYLSIMQNAPMILSKWSTEKLQLVFLVYS
jgi:hypothetical protein